MPRFSIDSSAVMRHTRTLERMHRSALPSAIRNTLNEEAIDTKKVTMPAASNIFVHRNKTFFKANSGVEKAQGFNVNSMKSTVGFFENNIKGNNFSIKNLDQQEHSGTIGGKSFIPLLQARKGNSNTGMIRSNARITQIKRIINANNSKGKNQKEKFVKAAIEAGKGGYVIAGKGKILFKVDSFQSNIKTRKTQLKVTPLFRFKRRGKIKVNATHFMEKASLQTAKKADSFYIKQAEFQINRLR